MGSKITPRCFFIWILQTSIQTLQLPAAVAFQSTGGMITSLSTLKTVLKQRDFINKYPNEVEEALRVDCEVKRQFTGRRFGRNLIRFQEAIIAMFNTPRNIVT